MGTLNPLLQSFKAVGATGTGGPVAELWSVKYASKVAGDAITINSGEFVMFDLAQSPVYGAITNNGKLTTSRAYNTELRFKSFMNHGIWEIGTPENPWPRNIKHIITPSGPRSADISISDPRHAVPSDNRGVMNMGGEICWVAVVPDVVICKLGDTANAGDAFITSEVPMTLAAGDWLQLGTSMYWQEGMDDLTAANGIVGSNGDGTNATQFGRRPGYGSEIVKVASAVVNSTLIPINQTISLDGSSEVTSTVLQYTHWGKLQYLCTPVLEGAANTRLRTTPYTIQPTDIMGTVNGRNILGSRVLDAVANGVSTVVDNRATIGLLTHPIKFGAPPDADWITYGYGAHLMTMQLGAKNRMQGVERYRVGQAGFLGRYPDHQHMRSWGAYGTPSSGTFFGDVDPAFNWIKRCSQRRSSNRGSTIHGTCGFLLYQNVYSDTDTHCIFLEDGSEGRNVIDGNFISGVGSIGYGATPIKNHDVSPNQGQRTGGACGIWYTNPENYLRNNIIAGSYIGIWHIFGAQCFGQSRECGIVPNYRPILQWENNEFHSTVFYGMITAGHVADEDGTVPDDRTPGFFGGNTAPHGGLIHKARLWKVIHFYFNEVFPAEYDGWQISCLRDNNTWTGADDPGVFGRAEGNFSRASVFTHTIDDYYRVNLPFVINTGVPSDNSAHTAMVTYHNTLHRPHCLFVSAPMGTMRMTGGPMCRIHNNGGVMQCWDFYENAVEMQFLYDVGGVYLGHDAGYPGVRFPPIWKLSEYDPAYLAAIGHVPADFDTEGENTSWRAMAAALKLPDDGSMFEHNGWWVYNNPFHIYGIDPALIEPAQAPAGLTGLNGVLVNNAESFLGFWTIRANGVDITGEAGGGIPAACRVYFDRIADDNVTVVGSWNVLGPGPDVNYYNKRHCCVRNGATVRTRWDRAQVPLPVSAYGEIWGMTRPTSNIVVGIDWNHNTAVTTGYIYNASQSATANISPGPTSLAQVKASTTNCYWKDNANDKLWMHLWVVKYIEDDYTYGNYDSIHIHNTHYWRLNNG